MATFTSIPPPSSLVVDPQTGKITGLWYMYLVNFSQAATGFLINTNNLSDVSNATTARNNIGALAAAGANTVVTVGTVTTGTWQASVIGTQYGGTGLSSYAQGDLIYSSATNTLAKLAKNTSSTRYLSNTGTNNNPAWAQINLTNGVTGTLPVANGGTGITSLGTGIDTFLGTPSSANLRAAVTDETGTGALVFATSPTIATASLSSPTMTTPVLGTPSSGTLTSCTGLPISTGLTDTAWTSFTPGFTGFSANPSSVVAYYKIIGKTCHIYISMSTGTSNAATFTITGLPATSIGRDIYTPICLATNGGATAMAYGVVAASTTTLACGINGSLAGWTTSLGKSFLGQFFYEIV